MEILLLVIVLAAIAWGVFHKVAQKDSSLKPADSAAAAELPRRRQLLSEREQAMHHRLSHALPELVVLAQVSFNALLSARTSAVRNTFDRKIADFVVCDKAFQVLAVIELDDASHKGKADKDAARDAMLVGAGYRVLRYANVPDIDRVRGDFVRDVAHRPVAAPNVATLPG